MQSDADFQNDASNSNLCLLLMSGLMPISVVVAVLRYQAQVQLEISETELSKFDTIFTAGKYEMLVEILVLLLQPYPFLNGRVRLTQISDSVPSTFATTTLSISSSTTF